MPEPLTRGATIQKQGLFRSLSKRYSTEQEADIWLIKSFHVSELSYRTLQKEYAPYARFKAFREKKIYGCDSSRCNYYEETPFRPDLLLQELAALFHPGLFPDYRFRYYQPLSE